ncbi:hypothetical protein LY78DRAFT_288480 [Colletotrichum sublineola]|nr:hypothetical protein LY78DRAFT_288480 [Colletotrichum sublineola]
MSLHPLPFTEQTTRVHGTTSIAFPKLALTLHVGTRLFVCVCVCVRVLLCAGPLWGCGPAGATLVRSVSTRSGLEEGRQRRHPPPPPPAPIVNPRSAESGPEPDSRMQRRCTLSPLCTPGNPALSNSSSMRA